MFTHNQGVVFLVHTIAIEDENQCLNKFPYEYVPTLLLVNKNEKLKDEKLCNVHACVFSFTIRAILVFTSLHGFYYVFVLYLITQYVQ